MKIKELKAISSYFLSTLPKKWTAKNVKKNVHLGRVDKVGETSKVPLQVSAEDGTRMKS